MKNRFNVLYSLALIALGATLILGGFHAIPGSSGVGIQGQVANAASPLYSMAAYPIASVTVTAAAAPSGSAGTSAVLVSYGTDKDTYKRGDSANGFITIKNTGSTVIDNIKISVSAARSVPVLGTLSLGNKDFTISGLNIKPGDTKKAEFTVNIPSQFSGFSTAGDYNINGNVLVGGNKIGSFSKHITVV